MPMMIALLIPLFPLVVAILVGVLGKRLGSHVAPLGIGATIASCVCAVLTLYHVTMDGALHVTVGVSGMELPAPPLTLGLFVDRLSAVMMVLITSVSMVIHVYSRRYLQGDQGYVRFYGLLGFMTFTILALVSSANLLMLFLCWQLLSVALYLLLAFHSTHPPALVYARKTLLVHRLGDACFLSGLFLTWQYFGTFDFPELFRLAAEHAPVASIDMGISFDVDMLPVICTLIFLGGMAKSAQFPLHVWLPDTMDSPTPVSALMHAGIINAGGFLLNRLAPLYALTPSTLHLVFVVGVVTVLLGASIMLVQNDIKKTLGFSTMGQMGYMIMECGLGAFALAIFHLMAHGLFKASLFLGAGNIIQAAREERKFPESSGHRPIRFPTQLTLVTGMSVTLLVPLLILLVAHGVLAVPLQDAHGAVIFLFFGWVTASQATFSLYRLNAVASWKVAAAMIATLGLIGFTYLWAGEAFTHFLYPAPGQSDAYFEAAALHPQIFDALIFVSTLIVLGGWFLVYANAQGKKIFNPQWVQAVRQPVYVLLMNRCYIDHLYSRWGDGLLRLAQKIAQGAK